MPRAGVSPIMKGLAALLAVAGIVVCIWYLRTSHTSAAAPSHGNRSAGETPPPSRPVDHVTRLDPVERKALADRIAAAHAGRAAHPASTSGLAAVHAPEPPRLPAHLPDDSKPPISKTQIRDAMREVVPMLGDCYEAALPTLLNPNINITAHLTLTGDPDIGTIIDADKLSDDAGQPLPAKFDDCLRSTLQELALPPLAEGDQIEVNYPFRFAQL